MTTSTAAIARTRRMTTAAGKRESGSIGPPRKEPPERPEAGSGREVSLAPPRARPDWPGSGILPFDRLSAVSVTRGGGLWAPIHSAACSSVSCELSRVGPMGRETSTGQL